LENREPRDEDKSYYSQKIPKLKNMIHEGKMTQKDIVDFAKIFIELGIGENPAVVISDYQAAISEAFKSKTGNTGEKFCQQLILSEYEKDEIVKKISEKNPGMTGEELKALRTQTDSIFADSGGYLYFGDGAPVTMQYQIEEIISKYKQDGKITTKAEEDKLRHDLNNLYVNKKGELYDVGGGQMTDPLVMDAGKLDAHLHVETQNTISQNVVLKSQEDRKIPVERALRSEEKIGVGMESTKMAPIPQIPPKWVGENGEKRMKGNVGQARKSQQSRPVQQGSQQNGVTQNADEGEGQGTSQGNKPGRKTARNLALAGGGLFAGYETIFAATFSQHIHLEPVTNMAINILNTLFQ
jgi:hypothetical protein